MLDRDAYHHGDLQNALVTTATVLVEDAGPEAFSLREVARRYQLDASARPGRRRGGGAAASAPAEGRQAATQHRSP
jgi:hypothetical protein